jgi:hypothetical protein
MCSLHIPVDVKADFLMKKKKKSISVTGEAVIECNFVKIN